METKRVIFWIADQNINFDLKSIRILGELLIELSISVFSLQQQIYQWRLIEERKTFIRSGERPLQQQQYIHTTLITNKQNAPKTTDRAINQSDHIQ